MGMSWDVFGNGKTAVKANIGKYLEGAGVSNNWANANPTLRAPGSGGPFAPLSVTRSWTDANRNFVPDCNLANPGAQSPATTGSIDSCGAISNQSFALLSQGQFPLTNNFDPALLNGWGVRASDWTLGASVQQQIMARASIEVAYTRRWYHGFTVLDNQALSNSDLTPYSITAPADSTSSRRRRLYRRHALRRQPGEVRTGQQPRDRLAEVRRLVSVLQRRGRDA